MVAYNQGTYHPVNRKKYIGTTDPTYRSNWELIIFSKLDQKEDVYRWGSEILPLPYVYELDGKKHRYYVDLYVEIINRKENVINKLLIEVKPDAKLFPPIKPKIKNGKALKNYNYRIAEYVKNLNKWKCARAYSSSNNMTFYILTEKGMYLFEEGRPVKVSSAKFF